MPCKYSLVTKLLPHSLEFETRRNICSVRKYEAASMCAKVINTTGFNTVLSTRDRTGCGVQVFFRTSADEGLSSVFFVCQNRSLKTNE